MYLVTRLASDVYLANFRRNWAEELSVCAPIVRTLAEHCDCAPAEVAWWVTAMGGNDGTALTLATVARDAGIEYRRLYNARLSGDECARVADVLTAYRDEMFTPMIDALREAYEERARVLGGFAARLAAFTEADGPARSMLDCLDRLQLPIVIGAQMPEQPSTEYVPGGYRYPTISCPKCGYAWAPRVPRPRKCPSPSCQYYLRYDGALDAAPVAQGNAESPETLTPQRL